MNNNANHIKTNNIKTNNIKTNNRKINKTADMGFIIKVIVILLIVVVCVVVLVVVARNALYNSNVNNHLSPILIYDDRHADIPLTTEEKHYESTLPSIENHTKFNISMWIYIENWEQAYGQYKIIFSRHFNSDDDKIYTPIIALDKYENNLIFGITSYSVDDIGFKPKFNRFTHKQIPLQKWVNIVYNISDQFIELFINGHIENKYYLKNIFYQKPSNENYKYDVLGSASDDLKKSGGGLPGFNGRISKLQYFARNLNDDEIRKMYENGPYIN
jgi:hypothetical protein